MLRLSTLIIVATLALMATVRSATIISGVPNDTVVVPAGIMWQRTVEIEKAGFDWPLTWSVQPVGANPIGKYEILSGYRGEFHFTPSWGDTGKTFRFQLTVIDEDGDSVRDQFSLLVSGVVPPVIQIAMNHSFLHSGVERVPVLKSGGELNTCSMQLTIAFGEGAIHFDSISAVQSMTDQGWKFLVRPERYFRIGELGLPATIVNILGSKLSSESTLLPDGKLFDLCFTASGDPQYDGYTDFIVFAWRNCRDNTFQSPNFDTSYLAKEVESFDRWGGRKITTSSGIASCGSNKSLGFEGPCRDCFNDTTRIQPIAQVIFRGGGVDRMCCESFSINSGDVNLNGIPYEMADFELLADWLAYFDVNSSLTDAQLAQTDANLDGMVATVADMVYLVRVVVGDALPGPKLYPYQSVAMCEKSNDTLFVESKDSLAGILIVFKADGKTSFENLSNIEMITGRRGSLTTLLFKPSLKDLQGHIASGRTPLVRINGISEIQSIEVSDYNGSIMNVRK